MKFSALRLNAPLSRTRGAKKKNKRICDNSSDIKMLPIHTISRFICHLLIVGWLLNIFAAIIKKPFTLSRECKTHKLSKTLHILTQFPDPAEYYHTESDPHCLCRKLPALFFVATCLQCDSSICLDFYFRENLFYARR